MTDSLPLADGHDCAPPAELPPLTRAHIEDFVAQRRLAVVGASASNRRKFGNMLVKDLAGRGYDLSIVHPTAQSIDGRTCLVNLQALAGQVDGVVVCVKSAAAAQVLHDCKEAGIERIWLQQGSESDELLATAAALGLEPIHRRCVLMYAEPVGSLHGVHRFIAKLFGQLWPKEVMKALPPPAA
jgi:uncharacterized protein